MSNFNQIWNLWQAFIEVPYNKSHCNPFSGSHADTRGQTDRLTDWLTDRLTD